ncbi:UDP-forming cellulose synthase catalytic subunit [Aureimonas sp. AU12]|uniref:UDP-forming cellulose synthase catalytic subunit n=1 Tax=Aureimonas sp. AU12 TaxID=1638161 RepID=UPI0007848E0F|nr:UDP-forming cellulose synthase catalytic subunit [Aureimonas sp. AU12]
MRITAMGVLWLLTAIAGLFLISQPVSVDAQLFVASTAIALAAVIYLLRLQGPWRFVFLAISTTVVLRYAYWRTTATLPSPDDLANFIPAVILYLAEMYYIVLLAMNLFVVSDPLSRGQAPQLEDADLPRVDVFVPSYNEASDILALTLSSAKVMDYPADKLRVFLLDDGGTEQKRLSRDAKAAAAALARHEELQRLSADLGVTYVTRARNTHAKAGNLNAGLAASNGELVVVFDADHAPAREFLRETVGYFRRDPKVFLVQTPHFFSNPDPIEKNLRTFETMPSENEMFYGTIQKGLDKWNAAFFCGSAAVLRRAALEQVGGFSGVTITEDCETALDLHSRGWKSVYVDKPMVTGLQPETLSSFIGQRSRWCRGMLQILFLKNAALVPGLTGAQRICYLSSSLIWFFPVMRMIFMVAPLLFIFFNLKIYDVSTEEFFAYTLTYLAISSLIRNYLYGRVRWPWMSELYEYVQSVYLFRAIISVILNPRKPTFNVTSKGDTLQDDRLSEIALPYFAIFAVLLGAMGYAIYRYQTEPEIGGILLVVAGWNLMNLLLASAALGVVTERRERRLSPRLVSNRRAELVVDGHVIPVTVEDISMGGAKVSPHGVLPALAAQAAAELKVSTKTGEVLGMLPVSIRSIGTEGDATMLGLHYEANAGQYRLIAELMMSDMDPVRAKRNGRQRRRGLIAANAALVTWALIYPLRAFRHLVFDRDPAPVLPQQDVLTTHLSAPALTERTATPS